MTYVMVTTYTTESGEGGGSLQICTPLHCATARHICTRIIVAMNAPRALHMLMKKKRSSMLLLFVLCVRCVYSARCSHAGDE